MALVILAISLASITNWHTTYGSSNAANVMLFIGILKTLPTSLLILSKWKVLLAFCHLFRSGVLIGRLSRR